MFGSTNSFGQSSSSPFGSQSLFGSNNGSNNPFAPKPFGSTSPFGSQTGGSIFGGTSTGVFGATQSSSPMPSTPTFGSSSTPAFGSSVPAFGASSTPAFGSGSSPFGGSSAFGQKPAFGGFGATPSQASPFGNTFQQTQPAFGNNLFGSSAPFGASSQPAFGSTSAPAFGMTSTPAFGATSQPFGATSTPAFGSTTTPAFGSSSTSAFGSTGTGAPAFGSGGAFGASSSPAFGSSTTSGFGASSTPAFGSSSTPLFGASSSAFGASSSPSFSFGSSPSFGQSNSAFGSSPFGTTPSPFGAQSSSFGSQVVTPSFGSSAFGQSTFGGQRGGSRVAAYSPTAEVDGGSSTQPAGKLESISAMTVYKEKSHEELRWEDYQLGDKGGPNPTNQPAGFGTPATQSNPFGGSSTSNPFGGSSTPNTFGGTSTFGNPSTNPFSSSTSSNPFASKPSPFATSGFGTSSTPFSSSPFGSSSSANPFGTNSSSTPSLFSTSTSAFGSSSSPSLFPAPSSSSAFGSSPSIFGSTPASGTTSPFASGMNYPNTQSAGLFQSTTPSLGQTTSPFGQTTFGQSTPSFGQTNIFSTPSTGFGFPSSSTPSLLPTNNQTSFSNPFQAAQPAQTAAGAFPFNNFGQTQPASSGFSSMPGGFGQGTYGQFQSPVVMQPPPVSNPFGTLPAMPHMSIGRSGSPTVQYGISSMPVTEKPNPIRVSSLLTSRHISQRRNNSATRKYHPKSDGPKVPFYYDEEAPSNPKADALFIPRENPRALVIGPREKWPSKASLEKPSQLKDTSEPVHKNDGLAENGSGREHIRLAEDNQRANGVHEDKSTQKRDSYITQNGHRSGDAASVHEHGTEIESVLPKLKHADYYTEPQIQELAAKERAEPGFCRHVKGFVVGRQGYGSIKFLGETDLRRLDLESIVQFNNREVIVYMDDSKKPPVGQGLNKPAEVTLLNVKCLDKKTGKQCTEGLRVEKYRDMLMKKAQDQGVEFISYDPRKGEWKFKVNHFSSYGLDVEDEVV